MEKETMDPKVTALLALEAMIIENPPETYQLEKYLHRTFRQIETVLAAERPEQVLNGGELTTFQRLLTGYLGLERRQEDRRKEERTIGSDRRKADRRRAA